MIEYKQPFFSIVIANYNHGLFLDEAIQSILNQDCNDYEIIMVDGGSTDNSLEVIQKYQDKFSWWVSEKDNGQSDAFNKGFKKAKGSFFFWLNADDLLLPNTLAKAKQHLQKNANCKWLAGNTMTMNENKIFRWCIRGPRYNDYLIRNGTVYIYGPTSFFSSDLFRQSGGFDESLNYVMDTDLWYRFVNMGMQFERLNHYCWGLRIHKDSKTSHAFSGKPNGKFEKEKLYIQKKNNHQIQQSIEFLQLVWKIITGCLIIKLFDNLRYKNSDVI